MPDSTTKISWLEKLGVTAFKSRELASADGGIVVNSGSPGASAASVQAESLPVKAKINEGGEAQAVERQLFEDRRRTFKQARAQWVAAKSKAEADLEKVKDGARLQYLADLQQFPRIEQGCRKIDAILDNLDDEMRNVLDQYASTLFSRQAKLHELGGAATQILDRYLQYVTGDPVLKAIDQKEFADVTVHAPIMKALTVLRKALL